MPDSVSALDRLLFAGIVLFTALLIGESRWSPNDGQTFQVLSGLLTGFAGAFLARIKPAEKHLPPGTVATATATTITPPEPQA